LWEWPKASWTKKTEHAAYVCKRRLTWERPKASWTKKTL